ncbi:MAG: hypothetical protein EB140_13625 [Proteobacteria bacterium]|nr:hypothetical protein [Pseudomonadota bacterium]
MVADTAAKFRFAVPEKLEFFGDDLAASAFAEARRRMEAMGGTAVEIDYTPFAEAQAMLYSPAGAAERTAAWPISWIAIPMTFIR